MKQQFVRKFNFQECLFNLKQVSILIVLPHVTYYLIVRSLSVSLKLPLSVTHLGGIIRYIILYGVDGSRSPRVTLNGNETKQWKKWVSLKELSPD